MITPTVSKRTAQFENFYRSEDARGNISSKDSLKEIFTSLLTHRDIQVKQCDQIITFLDASNIPNIKDLEVQAIAAHCPHIAHLCIKSKQVTDLGVSALGTLKSLQTLSIGYNLQYESTENYAEGLHKISELPCLKTLDLSGCHYLSPHTFCYLHHFQQLEVLRFPKMCKVNEQALTDLEKSLPNTVISFGQLSPCQVSLYSLDY